MIARPVLLLSALLSFLLVSRASAQGSCAFDSTLFSQPIRGWQADATEVGGVAIADFNKDGVMDVAGHPANNRVRFYLGEKGVGGAWTGGLTPLQANWLVGTGGRGLVAADFNRDGYPDLLSCDATNTNVRFSRPGVPITADGTSVFFARSADNAQAVDLDLDGVLDVVLFGGTTPSIVMFKCVPTLSLAGASFSIIRTISDFSVYDGVCADLNNDGAYDLAVVDAFRTVRIYLGQLDASGRPSLGSFGAPSDYVLPAGSSATDVAVADFNEDGVLDIVTSTGLNSVAVLLNQGGGAFRAPQLYAASGPSQQVLPVDLDRDGILDVIASSFGATTKTLLRGLGSNTVGNGSFSSGLTFLGGGSYMAESDIDADGSPDVIAASIAVSVLRGVCGSGVAALLVSTSGPGRIVVTPEPSSSPPVGYQPNASVMLTAVPALGSRLVRWSGASSDTNGSVLWSARGRGVFHAAFLPIGYRVITSIVGLGSIQQSTNQVEFRSGDRVTLTATPFAQQIFLGWTGDTVTTSPSLEVVFRDRDIRVVANFAPTPQYPLQVSVAGAGTVTKSPDQAVFLQGSVVTLTAQPGSAQRFVGWSGDTTAASAVLQYTFVSRGLSVTANFEPIPRRRLNITQIGQGGVSVSPALDSYLEGEFVSLNATNSVVGFEFERWSGDTASVNRSLTLQVGPRDMSVTAHFVERSYPLHVEVVGPGAVTRTPDSTSYRTGTTVHLDPVRTYPEDYPSVTWRVCSSPDFGSSTCAVYYTTSRVSVVMDGPKFVRVSFEPSPGSPVIQSIRDVPGDQGGYVKVSWARPRSLFCSSTFQYWLFREVPPFNGVSELASGTASEIPEGGELVPGHRYIVKTIARGTDIQFWEYLGAVPDAGLPFMSYVAPTTSDSVAGDPAWTRFMVQYRSANGCWTNSPPDSGKSVDNVAPGVPQHFMGFEGAAANVLVWQPSSEADHGKYHLYRDASRDFVPSARNRIAVLSEARYDDPRVGNAWYKLTALDVHGNEGLPSVLEVRRTTSVEAAPMTFSARCVPNPSFGQTAFHVRLPVASTVSIDVLDASGRVVGRLGDRMFEPGPITLDWDGRGFDGRPVPGGLYFARVRAGRDEARIRFAVVR